MSPIKDLRVAYETVNPDGTFSEGDTVTGLVSFSLTKETRVKRITVKLKGDADVSWTEGSGDDSRTYSAHRRYFKLKKDLVAAGDTGAVLQKGIHSFDFTFQIPDHEMPSSFRGKHGKIVYKFEAKVSRSWRWPSTAKAEINFLSKFLTYTPQAAMTDSVNKDMGLFSKGQVQMTATANKSVCSPGDTISVVANIENSSSKTMKPKFSLQQKIVYRASGSTNTDDKNLYKGLGNTINPNSSESVSCQMMIPSDALYTLLNCDIVSVEYYIKVYLDISFAFDPEVRFPLVVVPSRFITLPPREHMGSYGPYPAGTFGDPRYTDFPSSTWAPFSNK